MVESIKFYFDEHVAKAVARGLRRRDVDVLTAHEAGLLSQSDEAHLRRAHSEGRVIFTQDEDFLVLHASGVPHSGIAFAVQHTQVGVIVRGLFLIHTALSPRDLIGQVEYL